MVPSDPHDAQKPFVKWLLHGTELPLHQNLVYWLSPTAALEQSLRAIWDAASQAAVLIRPQIKLKTLKLYIFFLVDTHVQKTIDNIYPGKLGLQWG